MYKLRKMLIFGLAALVFPQAAYGAQIEPQDTPLPRVVIGDATIPLDSEFSILIDANTGHIIHGVNIHERAYPASMKKVMTALLLLESGLDMSTPVIHSHDAIATVMPWHSGLAEPEESLTLYEALHAIMLASANDTSNAIAEFMGGNADNFARMMTQRAHQLGAVNTNFTNAHGLWEEGHFTTAYDTALILREALSHEKFRRVIATQRFVIPPCANYEEYRIIYNTNRMIFPTSQYFSPDITGGKTGFTNNSRHTLASHGQRGDLQLISVIMSAEQRDMMYTDTQMLMDYGFAQFAPHTAFAARDFEHTLDLVQRSGEGVLVIGEIDVFAEGDVVLSLPLGFETDSITTQIHLPDRIVAPIAENFVVGRVSLEHNGSVLAETLLFSAQAGYQLSPRDLAALFPGGGAADYGYYGAGGGLFAQGGIFLNAALITVGTLVFAFVVHRYLQFTRRARRRRSLGKYRGYRGYSGPYRPSARDLKFKYRYK
ncbi:MAG: D-alanyl-D-alanine carboxypeptidase [Clostridiales bacterium]|nr:D-alanyl-D-alanine carboxypeptidase [Clostridiales bacterium]